MVKINTPLNSSRISCLIDSDVIINWLTQETDPTTQFELWKAPHKIITMIEDKKIDGYMTLFTLMELRFVLRRKKSMKEEKIKTILSQLMDLIEVIIPDEVNLLKANDLQDGHGLSPIDAVLLSIGLSLKETILIPRDKALLTQANKFLKATTPEEFLTIIK